MISFFGVFTLALRHDTKVHWLTTDLPQEVSGSANLPDLDFSKMLLNNKERFNVNFWIEVVVILICPIPYYDFIITIPAMNPTKTGSVNVYYLFSDFILAFMFVRVIFLMRAWINYSIFMDIYSKKLCKSYGFTANVRFAFKCFIRANPGITVGLMLFFSVLILAYLIRIFELPYGFTVGVITWNAYFDSIWCTIITMTTVGYGDVVPATLFGRLFAITAAIWGTFLISLLILSVGNIFNLTYQEQRALNHLLQTRSAARSITAFMRFLLAKKRYNIDQARQKGESATPTNDGLIE